MIKCPKICDHYSTNYCKYVCQFNELKEQNNKSHKKMIDLGFWDINGNYIEDYQEVDEIEVQEVLRKPKIKENSQVIFKTKNPN